VIKRIPLVKTEGLEDMSTKELRQAARDDVFLGKEGLIGTTPVVYALVVTDGHDMLWNEDENGEMRCYIPYGVDFRTFFTPRASKIHTRADDAALVALTRPFDSFLPPIRTMKKITEIRDSKVAFLTRDALVVPKTLYIKKDRVRLWGHDRYENIAVSETLYATGQPRDLLSDLFIKAMVYNDVELPEKDLPNTFPEF